VDHRPIQLVAPDRCVFLQLHQDLGEVQGQLVLVTWNIGGQWPLGVPRILPLDVSLYPYSYEVGG